MNGEGTFVAFLIVFAGIPLMGMFLLHLLLGDKAYQIFKAHAAIALIRFLVLAPIKVVAYFFKVIFEAWVKYKSSFVASGASFLQFLKKLI